MTDVMMQMMLGGQGAGMPAAKLPDLLTTLAQRDPRMQPLVQQLQARLAALSFAEKIKILEKLRDREKAIAAAGLRRVQRSGTG